MRWRKKKHVICDACEWEGRRAIVGRRCPACLAWAVRELPQMDQRLVDAFYEAALFLVDQVDNHGWVWSSNYLREHVRCRHQLQFANTISPVILREVVRQHPELRGIIRTKRRKGRGNGKEDQAETAAQAGTQT